VENVGIRSRTEVRGDDLKGKGEWESKDFHFNFVDKAYTLASAAIHTYYIAKCRFGKS
jgi:hypothetical protein